MFSVMGGRVDMLGAAPAPADWLVGMLQSRGRRRRKKKKKRYDSNILTWREVGEKMQEQWDQSPEPGVPQWFLSFM